MTATNVQTRRESDDKLFVAIFLGAENPNKAAVQIPRSWQLSGMDDEFICGVAKLVESTLRNLRADQLAAQIEN